MNLYLYSLLKEEDNFCLFYLFDSIMGLNNPPLLEKPLLEK